ncbi:MAG: hypothetical protein ACK5MJ_04855 [Alphaproteobacteria bacterium]
MDKKQKIGSQTAKSGFKNEHIIVAKLNNYQHDNDAVSWLKYMGYNVEKITELKAFQIPTIINKNNQLIPKGGIGNLEHKKADGQVQIRLMIDNCLYIENFSIKKSKTSSDFNQVDKRKVEKYQQMWKFSDNIAHILSLFTGAKNPLEHGYDKQKRILPKDFSIQEKEELLNFLNRNKVIILNDILIGRGGFSANYMIIADYSHERNIQYHIIQTIEIINYISHFNFEISDKKTTINIADGLVQFQRKGGTPDPTSLQFKFKPLKILATLGNTRRYSRE